MAYKIIDRCVCCHTCATNCPVEAITFHGSQYWIAPEVCISCGTCAELCPQSIIEDQAAEKVDLCPMHRRRNAVISASSAQAAAVWWPQSGLHS